MSRTIEVQAFFKKRGVRWTLISMVFLLLIFYLLISGLTSSSMSPVQNPPPASAQTETQPSTPSNNTESFSFTDLVDGDLPWLFLALGVILLVAGLLRGKEGKGFVGWGSVIVLVFAFVGFDGMTKVRTKVNQEIAEATTTEVKPTSGAVREHTIVIGSTPVKVDIPSQMCVGLSPASKLNISYSGSKDQSEYMMASSKDGSQVTVRVRLYALPNPKC